MKRRHPRRTRKQPAPDPGTDNLRRWRCPNCGQMCFTLDQHPPPDMCAYCDDMTTWTPLA